MFEVVIGLEVHLALNTNSKIFSASAADSFGQLPNVNVDPVCLGLPGSLPTINRAAVEKAIMFSLAVNCQVPELTQFHRKHYFYPDLPKNYQISQYDRPIGAHGYIDISPERRIGITRCHLEEDAGKSMHPTYADYSLVDLNRTGTPLIEMVTEPEIHSPEEARVFLNQVRAIAQALGVSEANPEEGKMRADVNVSLRRPGAPLGTKVEVKNLNSFKSVQRALEFEIKRQSRLLEAGSSIRQDTLGWDDGGQKTYLLRSKEGEADYRYLPEPDLPPMRIDQAWLERLRHCLPELPDAKYQRYLEQGIRAYDAELIAYDADAAKFFDRMLEHYQARLQASQLQGDVQSLANWLNADISGWLNAQTLRLRDALVSPEHIVAMVVMVDAGVISGKTAKDLLPEIMQGHDPEALVEARGLKQITDSSEVAAMVDAVIASNPAVAAQVADNPKAINALLGQVMKQSQGKAKPELVRQLLAERLQVEA